MSGHRQLLPCPESRGQVFSHCLRWADPAKSEVRFRDPGLARGLIVSALRHALADAIQWLDTPQDVVANAARSLAPGGWLAISGFGQDQYAELVHLGSGSRAPGLCGPDVLAQALKAAGDEMEIVDLWQERRKLWFDTPQHVLRHLRKTGVNGRAAQVWTRSTLAAFCEVETKHTGPLAAGMTAAIAMRPPTRG